MDLGELKKQIKRFERREEVSDKTEIRASGYNRTSFISEGSYLSEGKIITY